MLNIQYVSFILIYYNHIDWINTRILGNKCHTDQFSNYDHKSGAYLQIVNY